MAVGDRCQGGLQIGVGLDAVDLDGFYQRLDATPGDAAFVVTGEERVLAIEGKAVTSPACCVAREGSGPSP